MLADKVRLAYRKRIVSVVARWLMLTLIGWLVYALVGALLAFVRLGAPLFDWQWYLAIIILMAGLSGCIVWHLPCSTFSMSVFVGLLIWIAVGYFGFGQTTHVYPAHVAPVPISFWAGRTVTRAPDTVLKDLESADGCLYITVGSHAFDGDNGQALVDGIQRLAEHNIDVYLAVVASDYLSVPVHDEWIANVQKVAAVAQEENLTNVRGIIGDAEHPKYTPLDILGLDRDAFWETVQDSIDEERVS